jgi:hypothetical protein
MVAGDLLIDNRPYEYLSPDGKHATATEKVIANASLSSNT